jgi:hypothetical protein
MASPLCLPRPTPDWWSVVDVVYSTLQRTNTDNLKQIFPEKELRGHSPVPISIHVSVSDICIPTIDLPILLAENMWIVDRSWEYIIAQRHMNVEIETEAAQLPEKEYINHDKWDFCCSVEYVKRAFPDKETLLLAV